MLKVNYFVTSDLSGHLSPLAGEKKSLSICKKKESERNAKFRKIGKALKSNKVNIKGQRH